MAQTDGANGWFIQLQKHYPTSALITELVQIHQERFIVKAIVQISGVAIATSMAESISLEAAEDQARLRVLSGLGIAVMSEPVDRMSLPAPVPVPTPLPEQLATTPSDRVIKPPSLTQSDLGDSSVATGFSIDVLPSLNLEPIGISTSLPPLAPIPEISSEQVIDPLVSFPASSLSMPLFSNEAIPSEEDSPSDSVEDYLSIAPEYESDYESEYQTGYEEKEPENTVVEPAESAIALPTISATASEKLGKPEGDRASQPGKPKKAIVEEKPTPPAIPEMNEPDDLSTLIAHTDVEMDRIGWTKQEGREYLKRTYKKSTRQRLDVDELMDFLNYLRALPSVHGL